jgi:hypothetical protein
LDWEITGQRPEDIIKSAVLDVSFRSCGDSKCGCDERGYQKGRSHRKEWRGHDGTALIGKERLASEKLVVELTNARAQDYDEAYFIEQY